MTATMDFFGHQDRARRSSGRLVLLFAAAVLCLVTCVFLIAKVTLVATEAKGGPPDVVLFAVVGGLTLAIVGVAMLVKTAQLRSGGGTVATMLGGRPVPLDPQDPKERTLRNVVEEMSIASGVPVPEIYVLDGEQGINAFATGWSPADAAVAVTRGTLEQLNRDELQGVIAHEFSHVFHGDMRLNIRLIGVLFGIVCLTTIGRILVRSVGSSRSRGGKKGGAAGVVLFGVGLIVVGSLGVLFARLIQAAVSRQREFLADASAVQYTRNPRGIGLALAKIGGLSAKLDSPHTEEASHLLFADGLVRHLGGALATHPPLAQRIERVLPGFTRQLEKAPSMAAAAAATPLPPGFTAPSLAAAGLAAFAGEAGAPARADGVTAAALVAAIGNPQHAAVDTAKELLAAMPLDLAAATREPVRAEALVAAVLLDREPARREAQLRALGAAGVPFVHEVRNLFQVVARIDRALRLPLIELAMPALRSLPPAGRAQLRERARALALADGEVSLFEFGLLHLLQKHVRVDGELPQRPRGRPSALIDHPGATAVVLSAVAHAGARGDVAGAAHAFARAALPLAADLMLLPRERCDGNALATAVDELARVSPAGKRNLVTACAEAAAADGVLDADEADLLRALALLWDCPVPLVRNSTS